MQSIPQPPHWRSAPALMNSLLTARRLGLITDVDGTISPIVSQPEAAQVTPRSKALLAQLAGKLALVAVISGRAAADVYRRVGIDGLVYVGNHGLERWRAGRVDLVPQAARYRDALVGAVELVRTHMIEGMQIEDKGATFSIHYRNVTQPELVETTIAPLLTRAAEEHGIRLFRGRMVFELRPPIDIDKGAAFASLVREFALDGAVYLGDDTTDADALRMCGRLRAAGGCHAVGIGVSAAEAPPAVLESADVLANGIDDVEACFDWLASHYR